MAQKSKSRPEIIVDLNNDGFRHRNVHAVKNSLFSRFTFTTVNA